MSDAMPNNPYTYDENGGGSGDGDGGADGISQC